MFRPVRAYSLYAIAGAGVLRMRLARTGIAPDTVTASGLEWHLGAAYELDVGQGLSIVPAVAYERMSGTPMVSGASAIPRITIETVHLDVSLDWNWSRAPWRQASRTAP